MSQTAVDDRYFQTERVWKILLRIAPPVMLAQLIQALYNIVDSYFVGQYSNSGLTALSVIFPVQLIITAIAVGTGVGVNTYMARMYAFGKKRAADCTAGTGMVLAVISWAVFAAAALLLMEPYVRTSATSSGAVADAVLYGNIVCVGSLGIFLESIWTKVHQAGGTTPTWSWWPRASAIPPRPCSAGSPPPAPSPGQRPTSKMEEILRWPVWCTRWWSW